MTNGADMDMNALISELERDEGVKLSAYKCTAGFLATAFAWRLPQPVPSVRSWQQR